MPILYHDPRYLEHDTGRHPENRLRLLRVHEHLQAEGLVDKCIIGASVQISRDLVESVHHGAYLDQVAAYAERGGGRIEADTIVSRRSYEVASLAAGAAADAVRRVLAGDDDTALCLTRPPGHHALRHAPMGFCLINHVAVAARTAIDRCGLDRVLIVDWDVHHGNGTQDAFWEDPQVGFFSMHRYPFYPGTGAADEVGHGPGLHTTCNVPVSYGTTRADYLKIFADRLNDFAAHIRPQLVIISAGFDAHRLDPIGSLGLEVEDFVELTHIVAGVARQTAAGRIVSVLEGGYNTDVLPLCVAAHFQALLDGPPS